MRPINLVAFNACWGHGALGGARTAHRASLLGDVLAGSELREFNLHHVLDPAQWRVVHYANGSDGLRGSGLAFDRERIRVDDCGHVLAAGNRQGKRRARMNPRHMVWADVTVDPGTADEQLLRVIALHMSPARYAWLWLAMFMALRGLMAESDRPCLVAADWNQRAPLVRLGTGLRTRMRGIIGWAITPGLRTGRATAHPVGSDHAAVVVPYLGTR